MDRGGREPLARSQNSRREVLFIRRIREMLGFQAEAFAELIDLSTLSYIAGHFTLKKISGIKLDAGFSGEDFQHPPGRGFIYTGG